jgi:NAD-dependent SIR2 family protein deacetylase
MNSLFIGTLKTSQKDAARADGDAEIDTSDLSSFVYPTCPRCGGVLKPEVVFFGDNVPRDRVEEVAAIVDSSDAMLVVGSSLEVYSAFRFVDRLCKRGAPLAVINAGPTRVERTDHSKNVLYRSESLCAPLLREAVSRLQN